MRCAQFERRMNLLLDRRRRPAIDRRLRNHARVCEDCRDLLQLQSAVLDYWAPQAAAKASARATIDLPGLLERLIPAHPKSQVLAACLSLFLVTLSFWVAARINTGVSGRPAKSVKQAVQARPGRPIPAPAPEPWGNWQVTPVVSWVDEFPTWNVGVKDLGVQGLLRVTDHVVRTETPWLEPVQDGLAPLASSVASTFHVLQRTWPGRRGGTSRSPAGSSSPAPLDPPQPHAQAS